MYVLCSTTLNYTQRELIFIASFDNNIIWLPGDLEEQQQWHNRMSNKYKHKLLKDTMDFTL